MQKEDLLKKPLRPSFMRRLCRAESARLSTRSASSASLYDTTQTADYYPIRGLLRSERTSCSSGSLASSWHSCDIETWRTTSFAEELNNVPGS
jgi:hypothetical protein